MISIVIPSYNQVEYLPEAIESAWANNPHEIIVVDDGSTDGSLEVAKSYEGQLTRSKTTNINGPKVKVISQVNKGLASARNTGIMNAEGEWVLFLDADDILLPNCLHEIVHHLHICTFGKDGFLPDVVAPSFRTFGTSAEEVILTNPTLEDFKTGNRLGYLAAIRRTALLSVGGYSPKMVEGYEDLHLWINLLTKGFKISTIPAILWLYRTKKESMYTKITPEIHDKLIKQINKDFECQLNF